ncbi:uncharacterized protein LOC106477816 [Limulus polyphemus]|uniref:Uncharacterized protein LOC106477816 n=1 Tax=Limulus polyphemus TaxID=6850 RepID=A0ABM1C435_LIMPO|nr:uncharacterized protein LOC106477816 [Limulus polyphemus]
MTLTLRVKTSKPPSHTKPFRMEMTIRRPKICIISTFYFELSDSSKLTLVHQGGAMTPEEAEAFLKSPSFDTILLIRSWDDQSKESKIQVKPLDHYKKTSVHPFLIKFMLLSKCVRLLTLLSSPLNNKLVFIV